MSATGVDLDESDSHIGNITADTVEWDGFDSDEESAATAEEIPVTDTEAVGETLATAPSANVLALMTADAQTGKEAELVTAGSADIDVTDQGSPADPASSEEHHHAEALEAIDPCPIPETSDMTTTNVAEHDQDCQPDAASTTPTCTPAILPLTLSTGQDSPVLPRPEIERTQEAKSTAPPPPGKIILKLIERETIKIEPEEAPVPLSVTSITPHKVVAPVPDSTTPRTTPPSVAFSWGPCTPVSSEALTPHQSNTNPQPTTPSEPLVTAPPEPARQEQTARHTPSSVLECNVPPTAILSASARGPTFNQPNRPYAPSRLAHVVDHDSSPDETESSDASGSPRQETDLQASTRSILHELVRAEGPAAAARLKNVVEITSLDPAVAARATALLKMVSLVSTILT
jgi:hypothetical protein